MSPLPSREICFSLLHRLYVLGGCEARGTVAYWPHVGSCGFSTEQAQGAISWLQSKGLIRQGLRVGEACLTGLGAASVERALANPEMATEFFPAISGFYELDGSSSFGVCRTTLKLWLHQLDDCADALEQRVSSERCLEKTVCELEERVRTCRMDPQSLQLSLVELRASL